MLPDAVCQHLRDSGLCHDAYNENGSLNYNATVVYSNCQVTCAGELGTGCLSFQPTQSPTLSPTTQSPTLSPTTFPTLSPTLSPTTDKCRGITCVRECNNGAFLNRTCGWDGEEDVCAENKITEVHELQDQVLLDSCDNVTACSLGQFRNDSGFCKDCNVAAEKYQDETPVGFCKNATRCQQGQRMHVPLQMSANRQCVVCDVPGTFNSHTSHTDSACFYWKNCTAGERLLTDGWVDNDRVCVGCPEGSFVSKQSHTDKTCTNHTLCGNDERVVTQGTASADSVCESVSATADNSATITGAIAGGSAFLVIVLFIMYLAVLKPRNANRSAENMAEIEAEIRESLALGMKNSFREGEVGLNLVVNGDLTFYGDLADTALTKMMTDLFSPELAEVEDRLSVVSATTDLAHQQFLVILKPSSKKAVINIDIVTSALNDEFNDHPLAVWVESDTAHTVQIVGVHVAIPHRVVREIDSSRIQRIEKLGEGNFAEVFLCQLDEKDKGIPPYPVAAKVQRADQRGGSHRTDLLREGALMALLDHPNLVSIIGIVTKPRDMPVVLLMQLCARGSLDVYLSSIAEEGGVLEQRIQLSFIADITRGLEHLANRRIVHRDVAARNVMLSSSYLCKLGDFGLSHSMAESKDYVRLSDELPVRWSAPEILLEQKSSRASDVWALGCTMHEILSLGLAPYDEFVSNLEVIHQIKAGNQMERHPLCNVDVYNDLLVPCWCFHPEDRPGFHELISIIVHHGGDDSQAQATDGVEDEVEPPIKSAHSEHDELADRPTDRALQAPSVHHLGTTFSDGVRAAVLAAMGSGDPNLTGKCPTTVDETPIWLMVELYGKPSGEGVVDPRDGELNCSYVDSLSGSDDVGSASALLSYGWTNKVYNIVEALESWTKSNGRDPLRTYIWICSLCINQHRVVKLMTPNELKKEFRPRVQAIGTILPFLDPWDDPIYITRAWVKLQTAKPKPTRSLARLSSQPPLFFWGVFFG